MHKYIRLIFALSLIPTPGFAGGGGGGGFPSIVYDPTQTSMAAGRFSTQISQLAQQANQLQQQIQHQVAMVNHQLQNLQPLDVSFFASMEQSLTQLHTLVNQSQGLAYSLSHIDQQFSDLYQGYQATFEDVTPYVQRYAQWHQQTRHGIQQAFKSHGILEQLSGDQHTLSRLINTSNGAQGNLQVMQAANEISALMIKQLIQLQTIEASNGRAMASHLAELNAKQQVQENLHQHAYEGLINAQGRANYTPIESYHTLPNLH